MVKGPIRRKRKYDAKVDAETLARQTKMLKPLMVEGETAYFNEMAKLEASVKSLVEAEGVTTLQVRDYLNYAREIFSVARKFSDATRNVEAQLILNKWQSRGLNGPLLVKIARLMGCDPTPAPTPIQQVDVTDRPDRELGQTTVKNFPSTYPLPENQITSLKSVEVANLPSTYPLPQEQVDSLKSVEAANLLNPHPVKLTPEDRVYDANQYSGTYQPSAAGTTTIISAVTDKAIRVYDFYLWNSGDADVGVRLYFAAGGKNLFKGKLASKTGVMKTFIRPWQSNVGDSLVLYLDAAGNVDYGVGAVQA